LGEIPDSLLDVSNGRLRSTKKNANGTTTYEWFAVNPINNYAIAVATGHYAHYSETFDGAKGPLTMDYWPLDYNVENAKRQFPQARTMLKCFEHWFGPYPWYEDGYKLLEVPNTGMEHQSAVSYGNWYANGYRKRDASGTGLGLKWDFIIVHESAHEWWGNSITMKDQADMWIHESFATYAEGLFTECQQGKKAGAEYTIGDTDYKRASAGGFVPSHVYDYVDTSVGASTKTADEIYVSYADHRWLPRRYVVPLFLCIFILVLYLLGKFLAAGVGRFFWNQLERIIHRLPLVRNVYSSIKQVTDFLFTEREIQYTRVCGCYTVTPDDPQG